MKLIPLTKGYFAKVDDEDYEELIQFKWQVSRTTGDSRTIYAKRGRRIKGDNNSIRMVTFLMHRDIMGWKNNLDIDHIDGDGLNNQKSNLRFATRSQNIMNSKTPKHSTKYKGVTKWKRGGKFAANIRHNGVLSYLGTYPTAEEAARVYDFHALQLFGVFAKTNQQMGAL